MARKVTLFILLGLIAYEALLTLKIRSDWTDSTERQFREVGTQNAELGAQMDRRFGTSTVDLWLRRMGLSCKKNAARRRAVSARRRRAKKALA